MKSVERNHGDLVADELLNSLKCSLTKSYEKFYQVATYAMFANDPPGAEREDPKQQGQYSVFCMRWYAMCFLYAVQCQNGVGVLSMRELTKPVA